MNHEQPGKVAILYPGNYSVRQQATPENNRLAQVFKALSENGIHAEPAVYHDDFCDDVLQQLMCVDVVLVWMNPIQDGRDRSILDLMLHEIANAGIVVSTHPEIILKMGTKEVVYRTRKLGWGCDTCLYRSLEEMRRKLTARLASGEVRVLKQYRGNGGNGVWKIELMDTFPTAEDEMMLKVRHAKKGSVEEQISLKDFFTRCEPYFIGEGRMIDQEYQSRLPEGMVRCYMVHNNVVGFGHQAVNALFPAPPGLPPAEAPRPGPRLYHPPAMDEFQTLKRKVENEWVPAMQRLLDIETESLPVLWDCDFLFGPKDKSGEDTHVLCEINVSSVAPFPESAPPYIAKAVLALLKER